MTGESAAPTEPVLRRALEMACADGWADGPGAMDHYLRRAVAELSDGDGSAVRT